MPNGIIVLIIQCTLKNQWLRKCGGCEANTAQIILFVHVVPLTFILACAKTGSKSKEEHTTETELVSFENSENESKQLALPVHERTNSKHLI